MGNNLGCHIYNLESIPLGTIIFRNTLKYRNVHMCTIGF
jgi:hypothetical protein